MVLLDPDPYIVRVLDPDPSIEYTGYASATLSYKEERIKDQLRNSAAQQKWIQYGPGSETLSTCSVADPDPGSGAFSTPGSGSRFDHYFREFEENFWVKNTKI